MRAIAPHIEAVIRRSLEQSGEVYVYGAEVPLDQDLTGNQAWDCSELLQVTAHQAGGFLPDGSRNQLDHCRNKGTLIGVDAGVRTRGALLFVQTASAHHVALSLGTGNTIEARGRRYGVGIFGAFNRPWTHAALIPGFDYSSNLPLGGRRGLEMLTEKEVDHLRDMIMSWGPTVEALIRGRVVDEVSMWERLGQIMMRLERIEESLERIEETAATGP